MRQGSCEGKSAVHAAVGFCGLLLILLPDDPKCTSLNFHSTAKNWTGGC